MTKIGRTHLKAPRLGYVRARTLEDVFAILAAEGDEAKILAGGHSLVPALNMRLLEPRVLVDINGVPGLAGIEQDQGGLRIGALARHAEIGRSALVARLAPLVHQAVPHIAHPAIRNRGTLGGSLAQADPAAELPACAVALDAVIQAASRRGERSIAASAFFRGIYETALAPDEIIVAVNLPAPAPGTRAAFLELARRRGDYAMLGLAATAQVETGAVRAARLVFFGVAATPVEATHAGIALGEGAPLERIAAAQEALDDDLGPAGALQADGAVTRHLARVLLARGVHALVGGTA
jgi:aerobic carbon-monoxide dehydrogenase medium subunit